MKQEVFGLNMGEVGMLLFLGMVFLCFLGWIIEEYFGYLREKRKIEEKKNVGN